MAGQNKVRKVTQEEMGKRKGNKLQIKDRKGKKKAAVPEGFATRMTEKKAAFYKEIVETDFGYLFFTEEMFPYYPGGPAAAMAMNITTRWAVKTFKEHAARRLREFEATGHLEGYPPPESFPQA